MARLIGILFLLLFTLACNDKVQIKRLYTYPESNQISSFKNGKYPELYLSIVGDLSQQIYPVVEQRSEGSPSMMPSTLKVGGIAYLSSYLSTLREKINKETGVELLSIAVGKTIPNSTPTSRKLEIITQSINHLNLDMIHLELNESKWLRSQSSFPENLPPMVNSNIFDIKTGKPLEKASALPYFIKQVGMTKIGVIAISSYNFLTPEQKKELDGIYYQDPLTAILRTKNLLKAKDVGIYILLYQGYLTCPEIVQSIPIAFEKLENQKCLQDKNSELYKLISKLPPKTLDLVISSTTQLSSGKVLETPLLGVPHSKYFISMVKLAINEEKRTIVEEESYTLPPLKICHKVFAGLEDCVLNAPLPEMNEKRFEYLENTAFGLIPSKFLGTQIKEDELIEKIINGK